MDSEEEALGELIPLALSRAHYYERVYNIRFGELETAAMLGAWKAVKRHDPSKGASLRTYARRRIDGEIIDWFRTDLSTTGGSRKEHLRADVRCVDFSDLSTSVDGYMSDAAVIEKMEQGRTVEKSYQQIVDHDMLMHLKTRMDEKEWDIMVRCVCNEEFMKDVGKDYGISESRICQLLPVALRHARKIIEDMQCENTASLYDPEDYKEAEWIAKLSSMRSTGT